MTPAVVSGALLVSQNATSAANAAPSTLAPSGLGTGMRRASSGCNSRHWIKPRISEGAGRDTAPLRTGGVTETGCWIGTNAVISRSGNPAISANRWRSSAPKTGAASWARSGLAALTSAARPSAERGGWRVASSPSKKSDKGIASSSKASNADLPRRRI